VAEIMLTFELHGALVRSWIKPLMQLLEDSHQVSIKWEWKGVIPRYALVTFDGPEEVGCLDHFRTFAESVGWRIKQVT
jgi:hypothetical protein